MEYIMGKKLLDMPVNMKIVKMISTINECKGKQIIYKKQPKKTTNKKTHPIGCVFCMLINLFISSRLPMQSDCRQHRKQKR